MLFGKLMLLRNNVLLMDEPTNHLDMESIESLNTALEKYNGTLIFVSHDREFVSSLATRIIDIRPDRSIVDYRGNYEEYLPARAWDEGIRALPAGLRRWIVLQLIQNSVAARCPCITVAMTTTVRLPLRVEQALATYCVEARRTKSEVIVELLEQRFMGTQTERTPYELAQEAGFIGCVGQAGAPAKGRQGACRQAPRNASRRKHGKKHRLMQSLLVDTGPLVALADKRDAAHETARLSSPPIAAGC
jgi:predicted DNA-binding protein